MTVWQWLFDSQYGVINWVLSNVFGLEGMAGHSWIIEPLSFYFVATVIVVWMSVPFVAFSVYAGLLQVPEETMEAAQLDGASARQRFWNITMPMVRPVLSIVLLLQVIWDFKVFTQIYVLQRAGAPTRETNLLGTLIYSYADEFSLAGALATIMLVITLALTGFYIRQDAEGGRAVSAVATSRHPPRRPRRRRSRSARRRGRPRPVAPSRRAAAARSASSPSCWPSCGSSPSTG